MPEGMKLAKKRPRRLRRLRLASGSRASSCNRAPLARYPRYKHPFLGSALSPCLIRRGVWL